MLADANWAMIKRMKPDVVIDAIIAKKNLGTQKNEADLVIGVGPGFKAGTDVHVAIESKRGHYLGRIITSGEPEANTGNDNKPIIAVRKNDQIVSGIRHMPIPFVLRFSTVVI